MGVANGRQRSRPPLPPSSHQELIPPYTQEVTPSGTDRAVRPSGRGADDGRQRLRGRPRRGPVRSLTATCPRRARPRPLDRGPAGVRSAAGPATAPAGPHPPDSADRTRAVTRQSEPARPGRERPPPCNTSRTRSTRPTTDPGSRPASTTRPPRPDGHPDRTDTPPARRGGTHACRAVVGHRRSASIPSTALRPHAPAPAGPRPAGGRRHLTTLPGPAPQGRACPAAPGTHPRLAVARLRYSAAPAVSALRPLSAVRAARAPGTRTQAEPPGRGADPGPPAHPGAGAARGPCGILARCSTRRPPSRLPGEPCPTGPPCPSGR